MKRQLRTILAPAAFSLILAVSFTAAQQAGEPPAVLLERAIQLETVDGDLAAAIELYQRIIAQDGNNRAVAAKALLYLGGCYEKMGRDEARKAYEQLLKDYPEQQQEVAAARQRLAAIVEPQSQKNEGMTVRMLWSSDSRPDTSGEVSPDGRYLSCMGDTGDLAIRDLETGESRVLTNEGDWEKSATFASGSRWSPDGRRIVYSWVSFPYQREMEETWELRIIDFIGKNGKPRVLLRGKEGQAIMPADWFPDGKSILALSTLKDRDKRIVRVSLDDGGVQVLQDIVDTHFHLGIQWVSLFVSSRVMLVLMAPLSHCYCGEICVHIQHIIMMIYARIVRIFMCQI